MSGVRDPFAPRAPRALGPRPVGGRPVGNSMPGRGPAATPMSPGGWSAGPQMTERLGQVGQPHPYPSNPDDPTLPMGTAPGDPGIGHTPGFGLHDPNDSGIQPPGTAGPGGIPVGGPSGSGSGAGSGFTPTGMGPTTIPTGAGGGMGDPNNATNVENILRRWGL